MAKVQTSGYTVRNARGLGRKIIPYVGCKAGFSHIFDSLIPDGLGRRVYDVFGGGGGFAFYACRRFGSKNVTYNDHNSTVANLITTLRDSPDDLHGEYQRHFAVSDPDHYLAVRDMDLNCGAVGAGRFMYLAKNAFSGKIRFNRKGKFNSPMRKGARCPAVRLDDILDLSRTIKDLTITAMDFEEYSGVKGGFVYLDPPYMRNTNGHYDATVSPDRFADFVKNMQDANMVMISEQNDPESLMLSPGYGVYRVSLRRSMQYFTQMASSEIIAINYAAPGL